MVLSCLAVENEPCFFVSFCYAYYSCNADSNTKTIFNTHIEIGTRAYPRYPARICVKKASGVRVVSMHGARAARDVSL
jgi:hypothetical protein